MSKSGRGSVSGRRSKVRHDSNHALGREVTSQWPRPGGRQSMVADFNRKRAAEEVNRAVAVIHRRLGMSGDERYSPGVVAAGCLISMTQLDRGSNRAT